MNQPYINRVEYNHRWIFPLIHTSYTRDNSAGLSRPAEKLFVPNKKTIRGENL